METLAVAFMQLKWTKQEVGQLVYWEDQPQGRQFFMVEG
jgi:hypothetical protein